MLKRAILLLAVALAAPSARAARPFVVTSRSMAEVTIDGGRADGLRAGDRLRVLSGEATVGEVEIVDAAERWSSCRVLSATRPIGPGDVVVPAGREPGAAAPVHSPPAPSSPPATQAPPAPAPARGEKFNVKYRSAASAYLDGGRAAGLEVGDRLRVVSGKDTVAELEVDYAAERSASCRIVSETRPVRAGDVAVRIGAPPVAATAPAPGPGPAVASPATPVAPAAAEARPVGPWARVRGSASFGYYRSWDDSESDYDYEERTARFDLGVHDIARQPLSLTVRGRGRENVRARSLSSRTPESERTDRLYELALRYEPPSDQVGVEVGRIGIYRFVGIGYLDGFLGRFRPLPGLQVGAFGGRVAEIDSLSLDGTGSKYGGFVRLAPGGRWASAGYDVMLAFVRENADGDVSRQYLSLESRFGNGSRWWLFERAELDLNTGWRKETTGKSTQLSNVSLSGNLRVSPSAWAFVSYDGRRNYRYYQNRSVPAEVFDDLLHTGLRAGLNLSRPRGLGATAGFGMSLKEPDPRHPELDIANAYSGNLGLRHADLFGLSVGLDATGFTNGYTEGGLVTARLGRRFAAGHLVDLSYGYSTYRVKLTEQDRTAQWLRLLGRAELPRRLYVQGDFGYDTGDDRKGPRAFLEVGVLF
jgi:hypothetical protein